VTQGGGWTACNISVKSVSCPAAKGTASMRGRITIPEEEERGTIKTREACQKGPAGPSGRGNKLAPLHRGHQKKPEKEELPGKKKLQSRRNNDSMRPLFSSPGKKEAEEFPFNLGIPTATFEERGS